MNIMDFFFKKDLPSLLIEEALAYIERGEHDEAISLIEEKLLPRFPGHRRALLHLGIAHMLKGDFDTAEQLLLPIRASRPMDSESAAADIALEKIRADRARAGGA